MTPSEPAPCATDASRRPWAAPALVGPSALRRLAIAAWRSRWLLALNAFLLAPLLVDVVLSGGGARGSLLFLATTSLSGLALAQLHVRRSFHAHVALAPFYVTTALDLYLLAHYRMRLGSGTLLVLAENLSDGGDYLAAHGGSIAFAALSFLTFYGTALARLRTREPIAPPRPARRGKAWIAFGALVASYAIFAARTGFDLPMVAYEDRGAPFGVVAQASVAFSLARALRASATVASRFAFHPVRAGAPAEPETYVLVIGESARPDHWGLYGAPRDTTPRLDALAARDDSRLVVFRDVVAQASVTKDAVPFVLTRGHARDEARTRNERSLVSMFRESGFDTWWLSTQQRDFMTGLINRYAGEAANQRFYERRYDGALLDDAVQAFHAAGSKRFVVLHTMGSHFAYDHRFPARFEVFPTRDPALPPRETLWNAYDDSVRYTDDVLADVIVALERTSGVKALVYVADHGENLRDDARDFLGHMTNSELDLRVPMFLWLSSEYVARHPEKVEAAERNARERVGTRSVFFTFRDLLGARLDGDGDDDDRQSLLAREPILPPRFVKADPRPFDFDERFPEARTVACNRR